MMKILKKMVIDLMDTLKKNNLIKEYNETLIEADWIIGCAIIINLNKFVR